MTIKFKGAVKGKIKGCSACGTRRFSKTGYSLTGTYRLPSGMTKTFIAGRAVEVEDSDGSFLLNETDIRGNYVFEEV